MPPSQFIETFPQATTSRYYDTASFRDAISSGECNIIVENRRYVAPIGLTVGQDVANGAVGVDEWVEIDNGNAYSINNFEWVTVGSDYGTQLILEFNTLLCD